MLASARRWRAPLSLGLGLPLLLGSTPAAAAGAGGALIGGLTPWVGIAAAVWALLASSGAVSLAGNAGVALLLGFVSAAAWWAWRQQRARYASALPSPARAASMPVAQPDERAAWPMALDGEQVLDAARSRFFRLQAAWDAGDVAALGHLTTPDMLEQLLSVLTARGNAPNRTHIVSLHAELLAIEEVSAAYLASVEFSGLIRESADEGAVPFRELWMLAATKGDAPAWRLARQQALF